MLGSPQGMYFAKLKSFDGFVVVCDVQRPLLESPFDGIIHNCIISNLFDVTTHLHYVGMYLHFLNHVITYQNNVTTDCHFLTSNNLLKQC